MSWPARVSHQSAAASGTVSGSASDHHPRDHLPARHPAGDRRSFDVTPRRREDRAGDEQVSEPVPALAAATRKGERHKHGGADRRGCPELPRDAFVCPQDGDHRRGQRHQRREDGDVGRRRPLERERNQDRPPEDGAEHRDEQRSQVGGRRPRQASQRERHQGQRACDRCPAHGGHGGVEPAHSHFRQRHREREEEDAEERPGQTLVPPLRRHIPRRGPLRRCALRDFRGHHLRYRAGDGAGFIDSPTSRATLAAGGCLPRSERDQLTDILPVSRSHQAWCSASS